MYSVYPAVSLAPPDFSLKGHKIYLLVSGHRLLLMNSTVCINYIIKKCCLSMVFYKK